MELPPKLPATLPGDEPISAIPEESNHFDDKEDVI